MKLPNKLFPFRESILSKFSIILECLEKRNMKISTLWQMTKSNFDNVEEFVITINCLFALDKLDFDENEGVIKYVERNKM